ncbi:MAG: F0F1 ATP synthase subunit delta [Acidiferrobacterales bacterium]
MSETPTLARPYAEAVFRLATERSELDKWSGMLSLAATVAADAQLAVLSDDPRIARARVTQLFLDVCGHGLNQDGANLVRLLQENRRIGLLPEIARQFEHLKAGAEGRVDAEVVSAFELEPAQLKTIAAALKKKLGHEINLTSTVDKLLVGGVIIRAGDLVIDGSVRGRLRALASYLNR